MRARDPVGGGRFEGGGPASRARPPPEEIARRLGPGQPLPDGVRDWAEPALGAGLGDLRMHPESPVAAELGARALAVGRHVAFAPGEHRPGTPGGDRLMAHELAHTVQQSGDPARLQGYGGAAGDSVGDLEAEAERAAGRMLAGEPAGALSRADGARVQLDPRPGAAAEMDYVEVELIGPTTAWRHPRTGRVYTLGEAAGPNVLAGIEMTWGGGATFTWFNFTYARSVSGSPADWEMLGFAAGIAGGTGGFASLQGQLAPKDWQGVATDPIAELLRRHEAGEIALPEDVLLKSYRGLVYKEASDTLTRNEEALGALLDAGVGHLEEYALGLKEASVLRDLLEARRGELERSLVQWNSPVPHFAGQVINMDPYRLMQMHGRADQVQQAIDLWYQAFPLLSRLTTAEINAGKIESTLKEIRDNLAETRENLDLAAMDRGPLDLMGLDTVRARIATQLGPKASDTIAAEDSSRWWWGLAATVGLTAALIGIAFLPGGLFVNAAIGVAIAGKSIERAMAVGAAANSGLHVDDGLMSQMAEDWAVAGAVLSTVLAAAGAASAGFRVLRVGRALLSVRAVAPTMEIGQQMQLARLVATSPKLLSAARSLPELESMLQTMDHSLPFEQVLAIRALAHRVQGVEPPGLARESLEVFLGRVWGQRADVLAGKSSVYKLYSGATEANPLTRTPAQYLELVSRIAGGRPAGSLVVTQLGNAMKSGVVPKGAFYHFVRAGVDPKGSTTRVYLNLAADEAPTVMRALVREVIDDAARFPGVSVAKVAGSRLVSGRAESVVIYAQDEAAAARVLDWIARYRAASPQSFMRATLPMTQPVAHGVGVGAEPAVRSGKESFGTLRADAITSALKDPAVVDKQSFVRRALELLERSGVDPKAPHRNLPPTPPAGGTP